MVNFYPFLIFWFLAAFLFFLYLQIVLVIHVRCHVRVYLVFVFPKELYESKYGSKCDSMKKVEKKNLKKTGLFWALKNPTFSNIIPCTKHILNTFKLRTLKVCLRTFCYIHFLCAPVILTSIHHCVNNSHDIKVLIKFIKTETLALHKNKFIKFVFFSSCCWI